MHVSTQVHYCASSPKRQIRVRTTESYLVFADVTPWFRVQVSHGPLIPMIAGICSLLMV
jgi:hypothetical protein